MLLVHGHDVRGSWPAGTVKDTFINRLTSTEDRESLSGVAAYVWYVPSRDLRAPWSPRDDSFRGSDWLGRVENFHALVGANRIKQPGAVYESSDSFIWIFW